MKRERGTGNLRLRNGVWQTRIYHNGKLIEQSTKTGDEAKAGKILRARLKLTGTADFITPQAQRVGFPDLKAGIVHNYTVDKKNRSTRRMLESVAHLEAVFGTDKALAITDERVQEYKTARLAEGAKPATINRELQTLRRMFKLNKLVRNRRPDIVMLDESDNVREGFLEPPDFAALCTHLPEPIADAAWFAYLSLWRRANVLNLMWSQVTLVRDRGEITSGGIRLPHVLVKHKKPLTLVLKGRLLDVIRRRWTARLDACPYVFHDRGRRLREFRATWEKAATAIGRPGLLWHDLRRSGARNLRRSGRTEGTIMQQGGWKTRAMFDRYDVHDESDLAATVDAYDAFLDTALTADRKVVSITEKPAKTGTGA